MFTAARPYRGDRLPEPLSLLFDSSQSNKNETGFLGSAIKQNKPHTPTTTAERQLSGAWRTGAEGGSLHNALSVRALETGPGPLLPRRAHNTLRPIAFVSVCRISSEDSPGSLCRCRTGHLHNLQIQEADVWLNPFPHTNNTFYSLTESRGDTNP
jgi:hypothetical protein